MHMPYHINSLGHVHKHKAKQKHAAYNSITGSFKSTLSFKCYGSLNKAFLCWKSRQPYRQMATKEALDWFLSLSAFFAWWQ